MALWIWVIIFLLITFLLSLYMKTEVMIEIREDESFQGISLKIDSLFYKMNQQYEYNDPNFCLLESILISAIENNKHDTKTTNAISEHHEVFVKILNGFPIRSFHRLSMENYQMLSTVLKYLVVEKLEWMSTVGSKDALRTALSTGVCWAIKGMLIGVLSSKCKLRNLNIDVKPDFVTSVFLSRLSCILKIRMVHIILIETYAIAIKVRWCMNGSAARTAESSH